MAVVCVGVGRAWLDGSRAKKWGGTMINTQLDRGVDKRKRSRDEARKRRNYFRGLDDGGWG